ncbi:minor capsid protein [Clostridium pasteurianum]|uniref:Phage putative head morphogenesis protein, SPP1 gp7 family n=1 Tax=Clostridium pasteurianum BC1 TaxID=86416 RepID=R4KDD4_CLOPA|nr:minor capsid protein [Clostridium pasteurianum]AGK97635.1 phage putative head morphogenesis protein, SPP1 gp7 family [Clostridium pasteurianum BC1]
MAKINQQYRKTIEQIRLDSEDYADEQMQGIYQDQNDKLDEVHAMIGLIYIKYAVDGLLNLSGKQKTNILNDVQVKLTKISKDLGNAEVDKVTSILGDTYKTTYYKNAFVFDKLGINSNFNILKKQFIDQAINRVYKEETFSDRIWNNKASMVDRLYNLIKDASTGGTTIDQIGKQIKDAFGVQAYQSRRLVRTEVARNAVSSQEQIGKDAGCEQVQWSSVLDNRTAEYDASLDGQVWGINDDHPYPVENTHPNCRCILLNISYKGWTPDKRMDNETHQLIDYTDYATWAKNKGINDNTPD